MTVVSLLVESQIVLISRSATRYYFNFALSHGLAAAHPTGAISTLDVAIQSCF